MSQAGDSINEYVPVNFPASSGRTSWTAVAAPVVVGMMFDPTPRPGNMSVSRDDFI